MINKHDDDDDGCHSLEEFLKKMGDQLHLNHKVSILINSQKEKFLLFV